MSEEQRVEAIVQLRTWGDDSRLRDFLSISEPVVAGYQLMGAWSFLLRASFADKETLSQWLRELSCVSLKDDDAFPTVTSIETLKIIDEFTADVSMAHYRAADWLHHAFMRVDYQGLSLPFVRGYRDHPAVQRLLHVQGDTTFIMEVLTDRTDTLRKIISTVKSHKTVSSIVTQEVISVIKHK